MNRRVCACVGLILGWVTFIGAAVAQDAPVAASGLSGASTPAASVALPLSALGAADATPFTPQLRTFIQNQCAALSSADFAAQSQARLNLMAWIGHNGSGTPSYYAVFAREWNTSATPILRKNAPIGVRLNIAIVSEALASSGQTLEAVPIVLQLLSDREAVVVWWGVKAARPLIPLLMLAPDTAKGPAISTSPLGSALVAAVIKQANTDLAGYITLDAYHALDLSNALNAAELQHVREKGTPALIGYALKIFENRISQYVAGKVQMPGAEREISTFLSKYYLPTQQQQIVQDLVNLETYIGQRANLFPDELVQLLQTLKYSSSSLQVLCDNSPAVINGLSWFSQLQPSSSPTDIKKNTSKVFGTIQFIFPKLVPPPPIPVIDPPPVAAPKPVGP